MNSGRGSLFVNKAPQLSVTNIPLRHTLSNLSNLSQFEVLDESSDYGGVSGWCRAVVETTCGPVQTDSFSSRYDYRLRSEQVFILFCQVDWPRPEEHDGALLWNYPGCAGPQSHLCLSAGVNLRLPSHQLHYISDYCLLRMHSDNYCKFYHDLELRAKINLVYTLSCINNIIFIRSLSHSY